MPMNHIKGVTTELGKREALPQAHQLQPVGFAYFRSHTLTQPLPLAGGFRSSNMQATE